MAIENVYLIHRCCLQHMRMGTARMKRQKEKSEYGEKKSEHEIKKSQRPNIARAYSSSQ